MKQVLLSFGPANLSSGYDLVWPVPIPPQAGEYDEPVRVRLLVWARKFRQNSGAHTHDIIEDYLPAHTHEVTHAACAATGAVYPTDTAITSTSASAGTATKTSTSVAPPAGIAEDAAPNANLEIKIDGTTWKSGLGDGTERLLVDEDVTSLFREVKEHTITFSCGANGAILAQLLIEW